MHIPHSLKASIAALAFGAASHAMADVITLQASNLPTDGYLTTGTYAGSFNGTGLLPATYTVNHLNFDFKFNDDNSDPFTNLSGALIKSSEELISTNIGGNRTATRTTTYLVPIERTGQGESLKLTFGTLSFTGQTTAGSTTDTTSAPVTDPRVLQTSTIWVKGTGANTVQCTQTEIDAPGNACKENTYYTVKKTITTTSATDYTGMISFSGDLLTSLFQNDKLDFGLDVIGDLYLTRATLDVAFTNAVDVPQAAVPEPSSLALFGIALLGAAGLGRKRRA